MGKQNYRRWRLRKRGSGPPPDPLVIPTSGEYIGNDGPWSTFALRVGNPPQFVKVLASTSSPETFVVTSKGCNSEDPKDCTVDRGLFFDSKASTSWQDWPNGTEYALDADRGLPMDGRALYGTDSIMIMGHRSDPDGVHVPGHTIAQITTKDYFLGSIGLSPRKLSPDKAREGRTSNLVDMKNRGLIPSLTYGYTAGAKYRRQGPSSRPAYASLILGGYDKTAYIPNNVDFKMGSEDVGRDLSVSVRSISIGTNDSVVAATPIVGQPFSAVIDSAVSQYWLPREVCEAFARTFDLKYNSTAGLYLLNNTQHNTLMNENPVVSFTLANDADPTKEVTISLPYSSFELKVTAEYPHVPAWSRYFPIKPASNPLQFTLGRAFLQEAYLVANYETKNFTLGQRLYTTDRTTVTPIRDPHRPAESEVSNAATYGLIAGGCALAGLLILFLVYRCARKRSNDEEAKESTYGKSELDSNNQTIFELDKTEVIELEGTSRVEAPNNDIKCLFDSHEEHVAAAGPFELPANEEPDHVGRPGPSSLNSSREGDDEILVSPIDGTISSASNLTMSTWGPVTPIEGPTGSITRQPSDQTLPPIEEKHRDWR
ncbi:acid protease [Microthyrium microscopicum]|uniref:Acid protease n=1 Tax=Microthyrium microscopicum TaxID=703497 RepID=A0A6A6UP62_9PEZI|nr:acid protease [Microthyrium microscopicum]